MLFWITIAVTVIFFVAAVSINGFRHENAKILCSLLGSIIAIVGFIMLIIILVNNSALDARIAEKHERYEALVYQWENNVYDNDNDLGKRELITDIQAWNEDLAYYKEAQDDFWVGIFTPNIYDAFKFIEWEEVG